jgi:YegS/Rv2252/BmrU family lipid kinase
MNQRSAVLVVNTQSRKGERHYSDAKLMLQQNGITLIESYPVRHAERIQEIVRTILEKGHKFIIVGGGDGTISAVVDHFAYCDAVFGLLPLGTANSFCRTLGIPLDLPGAVDVLVNGKISNVDLGKINDDYFANGASIGLPAAVGRAAPPTLKRWLGRTGYLLVAIAKFSSHKAFRTTISANGQALTVNAFDIRIASGGYQGGVLVAPETRPDDGTIVVHVMSGPSKWAIARDWARLTFALPISPAKVEVVRAKEILIDTMPKQDVAIDGEVLTQTPIKVSVARKALFVMTPQSF